MHSGLASVSASRSASSGIVIKLVNSDRRFSLPSERVVTFHSRIICRGQGDADYDYVFVKVAGFCASHRCGFGLGGGRWVETRRVHMHMRADLDRGVHGLGVGLAAGLETGVGIWMGN
ncbi:hypothetical protein GYMLUDRAFT_43343 [Collybiopsis luxurians FD-317 M1]|uniref:Uncharacterized protein n=1 Tax=Collybiopsis luxurians FD-317 M1 TaxID=944289 RepID=A0A0D0CX34_9AGAR|nr:hypothetical protein GYMLUDRAFT_43343 [Collybiopsis luxurians FD-317 M1]